MVSSPLYISPGLSNSTALCRRKRWSFGGWAWFRHWLHHLLIVWARYICPPVSFPENKDKQVQPWRISVIFKEMVVMKCCCCCSVAKSYPIFVVTPWTAACQASLPLTKFMSIKSVMPSNHLILRHPLLLLPSLSQHQGLFQWVSSSLRVAKVLEFQLRHLSFQWIFRIDFL